MEIIKEQAIPQESESATSLKALLDNSFGQDTDRSSKNPKAPEPVFRILLRRDTGTVIGHAAVHERHVVIGNEPCILGMIGDVAISKEFQHRGYCKKLIKVAHDHFLGQSILFSILFACEPNVYKSSGYILMENEIYFLDYDNVWRTFVYRGSMYCELGGRRWPNQKIDLCGPVV